MTTLTGPLIIASGSNQGDGSFVAKVSVNGKIETDLDIDVNTDLTVSGKTTTGDMAVTGVLSAANHSLAASAIAIEVGTTVAGSALAGSSVVTAATWFQMTVNGTLYYIPAFTSA